MNRFKLLYFVIFIINLYRINAQISDKRLCVDEECKVPISAAKTLLRYSSPDSRILSFAPNADITIYSKSAGSREDLWGGAINGKRGYVPKHMVRETKVFQKPTRLVDTEFTNDTETKQVPSQVEPDKVKEPYEVVDGTTIYLNPQEDISPSSTESPIQSTALPEGTSEITPTEDASNSSKGQKAQMENLEKVEETPNPEDAPETDDPNVANSAEMENVNNEEVLDSRNEDEQKILFEDTSIDNDEDEDDETDIDDEEDDEDQESDNFEEPPENVQEDVKSVPDLEATMQDVSKEAAQLNDASSEILQNQKVDIKPEIKSFTTEESGVEVSTSTEEKKEELEEVVNSEINPSTEASSEISNSNLNDAVPQELKSEAGEPNLVVDPNHRAEETVTSINDNLNEATTPPSFEVTSENPELEVPQPFDDSFIEVTPNPVEVVIEEAKTVKDSIPTLPPLGLFSGSSLDPVSSEIKTEPTSEEIVNDDQPISEKIVVESVTPTENDFSVEEVKSTESDSVVEEVKSIESDSIVEEVNSTESDYIEEVKLTENDNTDEVKSTQEEILEPAVSEDEENSEKQNEEEDVSLGFFASVMSLFGAGSEENPITPDLDGEVRTFEENHVEGDDLLSKSSKEPYCDAPSCETNNETNDTKMEWFSFNSDVLLYLVTTATSVIIFLFGYIVLDKSKREGPLVAKINKLEKELLIILKENQILQEKFAIDSGYETNDKVSNEIFESLNQELLEVTNKKNALEEQVQLLEKELENSTEVGMELNRMLTEILSSESGSEVIKTNVEHLQRQLVEQQATVNSVNETLAFTNTENHELRLELELSNKKVHDLQAELDKLLLNILKLEEEKEAQQTTLENEVTNLRKKYEEVNRKLKSQEETYDLEMKQLKNRADQTERKLELKTKEHGVLTDTFKQLKNVKSNESTLQNLLEVGGIKAELQLLKTENQKFSEKLQREEELKLSYEKKAQAASEEAQILKEKYDEADKLKVEIETKLEVLSNYFKDREAQWQKEISKHEALWAEKEGEATSTTERIKFMQEQLQNYKTQTESLKQEIMNQEIELKSQISVLEKKAHENWVSARQAERKLEDGKQEAAQLRHRLTLRERAIQEDKNQHRLQSPIEQNGDIPLESPASPPLLYGTRDHITKSPPLPGLPPFLPPPPGIPFMPPPLHGMPTYIPPPPPNMFPGDHRPPPLGRMSSPPLNSRYSPSSRGYSPYDRNSSSPSDSEYGTSPPHRRGYSPFNNRGEDRRDFKRPPPGRTNGRNMLKGGASSGSGNSNESLEKISRQQSKV